MKFSRNEFLIGINYWPAKKAMYWWKEFDDNEVKEDFAKLSRWGFNLLRIFLLWDEFQPVPDQISRIALEKLQRVADLASSRNLLLMPTFFCGHMSGVNWIPSWMLIPGAAMGRFPVYSQNHIMTAGIRNFYTDEKVIEAQCLQIEKVCTALKGHAAVAAYDLGNESSNCAIPPHPLLGQKWLKIMTSLVKYYSNGLPVTLGMHAEDLEENRHLGPQDAARFCDFLCMHGYPFYLAWAKQPLDVEVLPFLGIITSWLGQKPVLFQEFGAPSRFELTSISPSDPGSGLICPLWPDNVAADFYQKTVLRLYEEGMIGCLAWCFADYAPILWHKPPLQTNIHERYFGLFRHDGSAKPVVPIFSSFGTNQPNRSVNSTLQPSYSWLHGEDRTTYYDDPMNNLVRLYQKYRMWLGR